MHINSKGQFCHGIGGGLASINNRAFSRGAVCGWLNDYEVVFADGNRAWNLSIFDTRTNFIRPVDDFSLNHGYAGGGEWAAWLDGKGLRTSAGLALPDSGLLGMGPDGEIGFKPQYYSNGPTRVMSVSGTVHYTLTEGHAWDLQLLGADPIVGKPIAGRAVWREGYDIKVRGLATPVHHPSELWRPVAFYAGSQWWICYFSAVLGIVVHPFDQMVGYSILAPGHDGWHNARAVSDDTVLIAVATKEGEQEGEVWSILLNVRSGEAVVEQPQRDKNGIYQPVVATTTLPRMDFNKPGNPVTAPEPPDVPPPVIPPPRVTMLYGPPRGMAPLMVTAEWIQEDGSGPITAIQWLYRPQGQWRWSLAAENPPEDKDHHYTFEQPGVYEVACMAKGPGGTHQTGIVRKVTVTDLPAPPSPQPKPVEPPKPQDPPKPEPPVVSPKPEPKPEPWWVKLLTKLLKKA